MTPILLLLTFMQVASLWDFTPHLSGTHSFLSNRATLGGIVSGKLSLSCWQRCLEVAVHAEQQHLEKKIKIKIKNKGRRLGWLGVGVVLGEGVGLLASGHEMHN